MPTFFRDPLLLFVLLGAVLGGLYLWTRPAPAPDVDQRIVVTEADLGWLIEAFQRTRMRPPTLEELRGLVERRVRDEMLYREAVAMGIDRGDEALRRRLARQVEYLARDRGAGQEPTEAELAAFHAAEAARYERGPWRRFTQVYVSRDRHGEEAAGIAASHLAALRGADAPDPATIGDPTLLDAEQPHATRQDVAARFGDDFAAALFEFEPATWQGPVRSGLGLHVVRVDEAVPAMTPPLDDIRERVRSDLLDQRKDAALDEYLAKVRERYTVTLPPGLLEEAPPE